MTPAPDESQPLAERRKAETTLRALLTRGAPDHAQLVTATRKALRTRLPAAHELIYDYGKAVVIGFSPTHRGIEAVFAIRASAKGVTLYLNRGKDIPDPEKLLKGSAKLVRMLPVESAAELKRPAAAALLDAAIALNPLPFATRDKGSVTLKQSSRKR